MSWDKMISRTRKKKAGKSLAEAASSASTSMSNINPDDVEDDATSAPPPLQGSQAIKTAVDVTAIVASSSALEDDDEGAVYADAVDVSLTRDFFSFYSGGPPQGFMLSLGDCENIDFERASPCKNRLVFPFAQHSHVWITSSSLVSCDFEIGIRDGRGRK